jgi:3-oxoacyl-[acyl-carrier protein] reductase
MGKLTGQTALITGGTRGIGWGIASLFAAEGASIAIVGTNPEAASAKAAELTMAPGAVARGYGCNVASYAEVEALCKTVVSDFGSLEILVNNAGVTRDGLLMRMKEEDWDLVMDVNLKSVFNTTKALTRQFLKQKYGRIINMSSINGIVCQAGQANYAASKAGVIGLTKSIAKELATKGITVNAIAPGFIQTDMTAALNQEQVEAVQKSIPAGFLGETSDIAHAALFLAQRETRYITGQILSVDGGMSA